MLKIIITLALAYLLLILVVFFAQRKLQYHPSGKLYSPDHYGLSGFEELDLITADHIKIKAWFLPPRKKTAPIILYFHGNAGNLGDRSYKFKIISENSDYGIMAISYRGYAGSGGATSEFGLLEDGKSALNYLHSKNYQNQNIIIWGESLGSGIAVQIAAANSNIYALVLEAPFSSIASLAKKIYWFLPVDFLLRDRFESIKYSSLISSPVIIFHGTGDKKVPYSEGKKLYDNFDLSKKKKMVTIQDAGHLQFDELFLINEIKKFLGI